mmetsp:Transcript_50147/g.112768  ORF Transcript_50147/g.112768 Transcript_50147/m.112768 type:complete len:101 (+) Transcript_50147:1132-1434(+)
MTRLSAAELVERFAALFFWMAESFWMPSTHLASRCLQLFALGLPVSAGHGKRTSWNCVARIQNSFLLLLKEGPSWEVLVEQGCKLLHRTFSNATQSAEDS